MRLFDTKVIAVVMAGVLCVSCGVSKKYIIIKEEPRKENFTNSQLRNYVRKTDSPVIVVRSIGQAGSISSNSSSDRVCAILESSLAKHGFDVRDRAIFESVAVSSGNNKQMTYSQLYKTTQVDLLMEVTNYALDDYYYVNGYYDASGSYHKFDPIQDGRSRYTPTYLFRGMSLTIKVILLKDNLIGGSYSYSYVPCSEESGGALIVDMDPLRYRPADDARDIDAVLDDRQGMGLMQNRAQRLDRAMEKFITDVVVPGIMQDMRGVSYNQAQSAVYSPVQEQSYAKPENDSSSSYIPDQYGINDSYNALSNVSFESLKQKYNIDDLLDQYRQLIGDKNQKKAKEVEDQLWEIEKEVRGNNSIPRDIREQFVDYIENMEDACEKNPLTKIRDLFTKKK